MIVLQRGVKSPHTTNWQAFLAGEGFYVGDYTQSFGPVTEKATKAAQAAWGLEPDGVVGPTTTKAARERGFDVPWWGWGKTAEFDEAAKDQPAGWMNPHWPAPADADADGYDDLTFLTPARLDELFGPIHWSLGTSGKVTIQPDWSRENLVTVFVPQLKGVDCFGRPASGKVQIHKKIAVQFLGFWQDVEDHGLLGLVKSFGGTFAIRLIRGSNSHLSTHTYAIAFDICMEWNGLGKTPAMVGQNGSVRELAALCEKWGFKWGGWFRRRKDGMHFEAAEIIDNTELADLVAQLSAIDHITPWFVEGR